MASPLAFANFQRSHLEPGGYFEQCELVPFCRCDDDTFREDSSVKRLCDLIPAMERGYQTQYDLALRMEQLIQEAGFVDVQRRIDKVPWSPWSPAGTKEHRSGELFEPFCKSVKQSTKRHKTHMLTIHDRSDWHLRLVDTAAGRTFAGKSHDKERASMID